MVKKLLWILTHSLQFLTNPNKTQLLSVISAVSRGTCIHVCIAHHFAWIWKCVFWLKRFKYGRRPLSKKLCMFLKSIVCVCAAKGFEHCARKWDALFSQVDTWGGFFPHCAAMHGFASLGHCKLAPDQTKLWLLPSLIKDLIARKLQTANANYIFVHFHTRNFLARHVNLPFSNYF